ncbi:SDR family oxidoreductase [Rhizobium sp. CAU 1783]
MTTDKSTLLVIGGSSDMARATAIAFAGKGWHVVLAGRDRDALEAQARDLALRAPAGSAVAATLDILDTPSFTGFLDGLGVLPQAVLCAVGTLGDQAVSERDPAEAQRVMRTNFEGPSLLLGLIAERFEQRGSGTIIGISSVAGDRGRASNYVYGAAKAGFTGFLSGLRNRLFAKGVRVITVKPGFVRTRMTEGMALPGALTAAPSEVAETIVRAVERGKDVVYVRWMWRWIMLIITALPEFLFKRTKL